LHTTHWNTTVEGVSLVVSDHSSELKIHAVLSNEKSPFSTLRVTKFKRDYRTGKSVTAQARNRAENNCAGLKTTPFLTAQLDSGHSPDGWQIATEPFKSPNSLIVTTNSGVCTKFEAL
jgi:hypothetical protein